MPLQNAKVFTPGGRIPLKMEGTKPVLVERNTEGIKSRVKFIAPREDRCIIQNRNFSVELCHVFARFNSLDDTLMKAIEFHLGVEQNSMCLDSRWNCLFASNEFHAAFDRGLWGLIPKLDILQEYMDATEKDHTGYGINMSRVIKKHDINLNRGTEQEFHTYTFLAFDPAIDGSITQYNMEGSSPKDKMQMYPFNEPLIEVKSHVHPKFIILSLGQMLAKDRIPDHLRLQGHIADFLPHLNLIHDLYRIWTGHVEDSQIKAAQDHFHPRIVSPPPGVSKTARHDNQSYHPGFKAPVTNGDKPVIIRRNPARLVKVATVNDSGQTEERGRSDVPSRSASNNNRPERDPSPAERIERIQVPTPLALLLNGTEGFDSHEDGHRSADISTSNTDRTERTPSPTRRNDGPIKVPALLTSWKLNDNNPADGVDNHDAGSTPKANRTSLSARHIQYTEALKVLVQRLTGMDASNGTDLISNPTQSIESPFPAVENGTSDAPLDDASDSDGDQLPVIESGTKGKEHNHQGRALKRQASNEPNLDDTPHSNSSTSSSLSIIPDHLLSPSPAGPIIPTMHRTPATKRFRR